MTAAANEQASPDPPDEFGLPWQGLKFELIEKLRAVPRIHLADVLMREALPEALDAFGATVFAEQARALPAFVEDPIAVWTARGLLGQVCATGFGAGGSALDACCASTTQALDGVDRDLALDPYFALAALSIIADTLFCAGRLDAALRVWRDGCARFKSPTKEV